MAKSLVIVESPAKARTITRYLGRGYVVKASLGHVKDLPRRRLGVDVGNDFRPTYFIIRGKEKVVAELRQAAQKVDSIYLAADPDREGEAICAHLREVLTDKELVIEPDRSNNRGKKKAKSSRAKATKGRRKKDSDESSVLKTAPPVGKGKKIYRVAMNEITPRGVRQAFANPAEIDSHLVDAQQARRILDRLVGYEVSPLLWEKVKRGLSAGRVQTVALRLVVEREQEIRAFVPFEHWSITATLGAAVPPAFDAKLVEYKGRKVEVPSQDEAQRNKQFYIQNEEEARQHQATLEQASFRVGGGGEKGGGGGRGPFSPNSPPPPPRVSQDALAEVRELIPQRFGADYLPNQPRFYKSRKGAQDAHEAIRPTSARRAPESVRRYLPEDEFKLYQLIWQRFVASQMAEAVFDQTTVDIAAGDYRLRATGSVPKFDGFLAVYEEGKDESARAEEEEEAAAARLPEIREGEELRLNELKPEQHFTQSPPRYTEATLVKELEEKGIGRPSTYAAILTTILEREYVRKDKGRFFPSPLGELVTSLLIKSFEDIFDVAYTARMEEELDEIEEGKLDWRVALREFYEKFARDLEKAGEEMENIKAGRPTEETCERCGKPMLLRIGRHGLFLACSGYPDCKTTREPEMDVRGIDSDDTAPESETQYCDNCGREMVVKRGRFGTFYACTGYPDCKTTKPLAARGRAAEPVPLEETCPDFGR